MKNKKSPVDFSKPVIFKTFDQIEKISRGRFHGIHLVEFEKFYKKYNKKQLTAIQSDSEGFIYLKECKEEYYYPKNWFVQYNF